MNLLFQGHKAILLRIHKTETHNYIKANLITYEIKMLPSAKNDKCLKYHLFVPFSTNS